MKRKLAYLALPLVLLTLMLGVKWRAEHPTPTKEDLEIRAMILEAPNLEIFYVSQNSKVYKSKLTTKERKSFTDWFYMSQRPAKTKVGAMGTLDLVGVYFLPAESLKEKKMSVFIDIGVGGRQAKATIVRHSKTDAFDIHPVTIKRWIELLKANPRIGPELRARLK